MINVLILYSLREDINKYIQADEARDEEPW
jgi:hypothetical protein